MSKVTELFSNLRFSTVGLFSVALEWIVTTGRNVGNMIGEFVSLVGLQLGKIGKFVSNRKEGIVIDCALIAVTSFFSAFSLSFFMFAIGGNAVGYLSFIWLWMFFAAMFTVWFLLTPFRKG